MSMRAAARHLNGNAVPLSDRMRGIKSAARKQFVCPLAAGSQSNPQVSFAVGATSVAISCAMRHRD